MTCEICAKAGAWELQKSHTRSVPDYFMAECMHRPSPTVRGVPIPIMVFKSAGTKCPFYEAKEPL